MIKLPSHPADPVYVLEVVGIRAAYGRNTVLHDVHCSFRKNRVTAIMGPSGCGKSTLVKVMNRSLELNKSARVTAGKVLFHDRDIYGGGRNPKEVRKRIGIIHQQPEPFPMSIQENVLFGAKFHGELNGAGETEYAERYLRGVGLFEEVKGLLGEPAHKLSGGQQQRLCLARTLANKPEIILMDEPCSALDPSATQRIEELIVELKKDYTIIIVTHNMHQAKRVSDDAILMFNGKVIEASETKRMFSRPATGLARDFVSGAIG
jgi:phosphate transport system ATP-binding protein